MSIIFEKFGAVFKKMAFKRYCKCDIFHKKFLSSRKGLLEVIWSTLTHKYNSVYQLLEMSILTAWEIFHYICVIFEKTPRWKKHPEIHPNVLYVISKSTISTISSKSLKTKIRAIHEKMAFELDLVFENAKFWACFHRKMLCIRETLCDIICTHVLVNIVM